MTTGEGMLGKKNPLTSKGKLDKRTKEYKDGLKKDKMVKETKQKSPNPDINIYPKTQKVMSKKIEKRADELEAVIINPVKQASHQEQLQKLYKEKEEIRILLNELLARTTILESKVG